MNTDCRIPQIFYAFTGFVSAESFHLRESAVQTVTQLQLMV